MSLLLWQPPPVLPLPSVALCALPPFPINAHTMCSPDCRGPTLPPGRHYTVSIAVAASCIENAQNLELATLLAGQIARAAAIFNVDEVVVLDDVPGKQSGHVSSAAALFARVLQFMETPQYLKK